jgi:hypothetical protein
MKLKKKVRSTASYYTTDEVKKRSDLPLINTTDETKKRSDLPLTITPLMKLKKDQIYC